MKVQVVTKTAVILGALIMVAVVGVSTALFYVWKEEQELNTLISKNIGDMMAADALDVALLRQRGLVVSYVLSDGDSTWLAEIESFEPLFRSRLERLEKASETGGEQAMLAKVRKAFEVYDAKRGEVISRFNRDDPALAKGLFLDELNGLYLKVASLCDDVVEYNEREIEKALIRSEREVKRATMIMSLSVVLTALLGAGLIWMLVSSFFLPLRQMTREMYKFRSESSSPPGKRGESDLYGLHYYMRTLMTEVTEARSDLEQSRRDLMQSEKLVAMGKVVAHIAHEIKNSLAVIGGFARAMEKRPENIEVIRTDAHIIKQEVSRMERMLTDIMKYSKPVRVERTIQHLNPVVEEALAALSGQIPEHVSVETHLDPQAPAVAIDPGPITQVVINLVKNAVEAMDSGGKVVIATEVSEGKVSIVIQDDGPGIPADIGERIYEPFFTTKKKGNGLGLAICRQIISEHGGTIELDSVPDRGATFRITLDSH